MSYTRKMILALTAASALGAATAMVAQDQQAAPPPPMAGQMGPGGGMHGGRDGMRDMARELNLTPDQRQQVRGFMKTAHEQGEALRGNTSLTPEQRRDQMRSIHETMNSQVRGVLNDDQKAKFDAMQAQRKAKMEAWKSQHQGAMGNGDTPPPAPPQ